MASNYNGQSGQGPSKEHEERPCPSQDQEGPQALPLEVLHKKIDALVDFLLYKYSNKELTTKAEMLYFCMQDYPEHFSVIFNKVSDCLYMVFGIDIKEVDPPGDVYALLPVLGLTYNEIVGDDHSIAKTSLLIMIITVIFRTGNCASEEVVWLALNRMQVYDGVQHLIYGDPRKFITEDLVQEGYLEYRQVPNSDPPCYEFLWGPRTHAETTKMKVLEHLAKVNRRDPWSYPLLYEEALRDQQEAAHARGVGL
ncbi:PREDICTED: melanoma-associated antigen 10-like [Chinchilla lanigera]|uniref:melanoma-associated antigen 10-like n=1 Tax=Chinchilla lanigera TaxID=34839 RepID=UPI00038F14F2|nr:PREDICTED: melanoma-associated antigen 10-like [Chinchilla lanigera]XP_013360991.1 PREDICTED: melanoma-associated antigen 10-like [Chinchilla lanigera]XP_013360992.1 PREDICTED: melanoma-associated antigen 10-like [Chinchilla lanigera]